MLREGTALLVASAALLALGCSDEPHHAPLVPLCSGNNCPVLGGIGSGSVNGGSGGGSSVGGNAGIGGDSTTLRGTVVDVVDDTFRTSIPDTQPAIVEAQGRNVAVVSADWNGIDPFVLAGVQSSLDVVWLSVRPKSGNASIRTLTPVKPNLVGNIQLPLIETDVIDSIFLGLSTPVTRASGAGHLIISFVSERTGAGVPGVKVASSRSAVVAYRTGGLWSNDALQTDSSGLVLVGNLAAAAFPGSPITISLSGAISSAIGFAVAADGVTLSEVRLSI